MNTTIKVMHLNHEFEVCGEFSKGGKQTRTDPSFEAEFEINEIYLGDDIVVWSVKDPENSILKDEVLTEIRVWALTFAGERYAELETERLEILAEQEADRKIDEYLLNKYR